MADKLSDREIERRKQQAAQSSLKPHEAMMANIKGKQGHKQLASKGRDFRHQGR
jgi:hypothetical protein